MFKEIINTAMELDKQVTEFKQICNTLNVNADELLNKALKKAEETGVSCSDCLSDIRYKLINDNNMKP